MAPKNPEEKFQIRQSRSKPVLKQIQDLYLEKIDKIPAKSLTGKGLQYLHNLWSILSKFIDDSSLPIHNNFIERKIKHIATGRKSWLFSTSTEGANATAAILSVYGAVA